MTCYSDHNEDVRTKGACDLCGDLDFEFHEYVQDPEREDEEGCLVCVICGDHAANPLHEPNQGK